MSRTYRKTGLTEEMTKVQYVNEYKTHERDYDFEWVLTREGELAYERAVAAYEERVWQYTNRCGSDLRWARYYIGEEPKVWDFKKRIVVPVKIDWKAVEEKLSSEYDEMKRDGRYYESGRNKAFKRLNKKAIRARNRADIYKEMNTEEGCQIPYAGDYIGKKFVWSIW